MVVLIVLAAAVAVLAVVLVANAARLKPTPVLDPLPPSAAAGDDAAPRRLGDLLGGLTPPVGNTGGKLPRKPKNRG